LQGEEDLDLSELEASVGDESAHEDFEEESVDEDFEDEHKNDIEGAALEATDVKKTGQSEGIELAEADLEERAAPNFRIGIDSAGGSREAKLNESITSDPATTTTKYIPPHLRAAALAERAAGDSQKVEIRRKLERKAQGCLNKCAFVVDPANTRLSEANMEGILAEVEQLYREYSRNGT
jgi:nucleolar MIF4G domain-containing protein 1